jgi:hypothetical protein
VAYYQTGSCSTALHLLHRAGQCIRQAFGAITVPGIVERLIKVGLRHWRRRKEDARAYAVALSDQGRHVVRSVEPLVKAVDPRVLDALITKQRQIPYCGS